MARGGLKAAAACLVLLSACATRPVGPDAGFAALRGWAEEDHASVFAAFRDGCIASIEPAMQALCRRAWKFEPSRPDEARRFFEANFRPQRVPGEGLLTAYFTPTYEARPTRQGEFTAPIRPAPEGLGGVFVPKRALIETWDASDALAWMKPEELFFMQIQGSAVLRFPDGRTVEAVTATTNAYPFLGIAKVMRERGLLADNETSGEAIMAWLAAHRGPTADEIMRQNPRYGFFALQRNEPGIAGAAARTLTPGRAIAVDPKAHPYGGLYWIEADAPALKGAVASYRRAVMALDTGGAIKGEARADLYLGLGEAPGREAGRVRHRLRMYELVPVP